MASDASNISAIAGLINVPVVGWLAWALITGKIHTDGEVTRLIAERDAERMERVKAQEALIDRAFPALSDAAHQLQVMAQRIDQLAIERRSR